MEYGKLFPVGVIVRLVLRERSLMNKTAMNLLRSRESFKIIYKQNRKISLTTSVISSISTSRTTPPQSHLIDFDFLPSSPTQLLQKKTTGFLKHFLKHVRKRNRETLAFWHKPQWHHTI